MKLFCRFFPLFCILVLSHFAHALHDPTSVQIRVTEDTKVGLFAGDHASPFFETAIEALPALNWALASALSLDTGLSVQNVDGSHQLVVGEHGQGGRYLIDVRHIVKETTPLLTEYFFEKGGHRFKIFSHTAFEDASFENLFQRASVAGGFIFIASDSLKLGQLTQGAFNLNGWIFMGHQVTQLGFIAFKDLAVLAPTQNEKSIGFKRSGPYDRRNKQTNFYKSKSTGLQVSYLQKVWIRKLELQCHATGGSVLCIKSKCPLPACKFLLPQDVCFHVGDNFILDASGDRYSERDVSKVLRLSVGARSHAEDFEPLFLANGAVILPAVGGGTQNEVFANIETVLGKFILRHAAAPKIGLPIKFGRNWIAIVLERRPDKSKLTLLDSRRTWDRDLFLALEKAVENALEGDNLSSPRVTTHHVQPDEEIDADGFIMIENLLRHLEIGGPPMPLVMDFDDVRELKEEHRNLLRLYDETLEGDTVLPSRSQLGLMPAILRVFAFLRK